MVDLKRTPSSSRIASQNYHTKPSNTSWPIRRKESSTITKPASSKETKIAIDALLSLGSDIIPEEDITAENSALVPVGLNVPPNAEGNPDVTNDSKNEVSDQPNPLAPTPAPAPIPQADPTDGELVTNNDTTESIDSQATNSDNAPENKEKKGTLITKSFTLPRRVQQVRSFKCSVENCNQVFGMVKDLNQHHRDNHPPVKCDMCTKYFSCPNKMLKHKYKHYEIMFDCAVCERASLLKANI